MVAAEMPYFWEDRETRPRRAPSTSVWTVVPASGFETGRLNIFPDWEACAMENSGTHFGSSDIERIFFSAKNTQ